VNFEVGSCGEGLNRHLFRSKGKIWRKDFYMKKIFQRDVPKRCTQKRTSKGGILTTTKFSLLENNFEEGNKKKLYSLTARPPMW